MCQTFSLSIESALEAIAEHDETDWAKFSFFPCPVGADTPAGCLVNPCPPKIPNCVHKTYIECCQRDKLEDCITATLDCYDDSSCTTATRLRLAKFLGCFEGGHIEENFCTQDPVNCSKYAGLESEWPAIEKCYNTPSIVRKASDFNTRACTAQNITAWPHVLVNKQVTYDLVPILPTLCAAYKGTPKPNSCKKLEQGLIQVV